VPRFYLTLSFCFLFLPPSIGPQGLFGGTTPQDLGPSGNVLQPALFCRFGHIAAGKRDCIFPHRSLGRSQTSGELRIKEKGLIEQLFQLKFEHHTGQLGNPMDLRKVRRQLAQIKTLIQERALNTERVKS